MPVYPRYLSAIFLGSGSHRGMVEQVSNQAYPYGLGVQSSIHFGRSSYQAIVFGRSDNPTFAYKTPGPVASIWAQLCLAYIDAPTRTSNGYLFIGGPLDKQHRVVEHDPTSDIVQAPRPIDLPSYRLSEPVSTPAQYDTVDYRKMDFRVGDEQFPYYQTEDLTAEQILDKLILAYRGTNGTLENTTSHAACIQSCWPT